MNIIGTNTFHKLISFDSVSPLTYHLLLLAITQCQKHNELTGLLFQMDFKLSLTVFKFIFVCFFFL